MSEELERAFSVGEDVPDEPTQDQKDWAEAKVLRARGMGWKEVAKEFGRSQTWLTFLRKRVEPDYSDNLSREIIRRAAIKGKAKAKRSVIAAPRHIEVPVLEDRGVAPVPSPYLGQSIIIVLTETSKLKSVLGELR